MIEVLTANTPNGKKITIMLEEIQFDYKITKININKDEQFSKEFKKISPFSKIPVIIDHGNNESIFESSSEPSDPQSDGTENSTSKYHFWQGKYGIFELISEQG